MSSSDVAAILGVSVRTVQRLAARAGRIKRGRDYWFSPADLAAIRDAMRPSGNPNMVAGNSLSPGRPPKGRPSKWSE